MDVEHIMKSFVVDESMKKELEDLEKQGYQLVPGIPPVIVYHLARPKQQQAPVERHPQGPVGRLIINEDLIEVRGPDGKLKQ